VGVVEPAADVGYCDKAPSTCIPHCTFDECICFRTRPCCLLNYIWLPRLLIFRSFPNHCSGSLVHPLLLVLALLLLLLPSALNAPTPSLLRLDHFSAAALTSPSELSHLNQLSLVRPRKEDNNQQ